MDSWHGRSEDSLRHDNLQAYKGIHKLIFSTEICFEGNIFFGVGSHTSLHLDDHSICSPRLIETFALDIHFCILEKIVRII